MRSKRPAINITAVEYVFNTKMKLYDKENEGVCTFTNSSAIGKRSINYCTSKIQLSNL